MRWRRWPRPYGLDGLSSRFTGRRERGPRGSPGTGRGGGAHRVPEAQLSAIRDGASLVHMMNSNIFTAAAVRLGEGADVRTLADAWHDVIRQNRWICGQPDKLIMYRIGDQILMAFGSSDAMQLWETRTVEAFPDGQVLYSEAVVG